MPFCIGNIDLSKIAQDIYDGFLNEYQEWRETRNNPASNNKDYSQDLDIRFFRALTSISPFGCAPRAVGARTTPTVNSSSPELQLETGPDFSTSPEPISEQNMLRYYAAAQENNPSLIADARLGELASRILQRIMENGEEGFDDHTQFREDRFELGIANTVPLRIFFQSHTIEDALAEIQTTVNNTLEQEYIDPTNIGIAVAQNENGIFNTLILMSPNYLRLTPVPRHIPSREEFAFHGRVVASGLNVDNVRFVMHYPDNRTRTFRQPGRDIVFSHNPVQDGTYQVEVMADLNHHTQVLAHFPIRVGHTGNPIIDFHAQGHTTAVEDGRRLHYDFINRAREVHDLVPVTRHAGLENVAQIFADYLNQVGELSHFDQNGENFNDRLTAAGINIEGGSEIIAQNTTAEGAFNGFMQDTPAHRRAILGRAYRHVGIGVTRTDNNHLIFVHIYATFESDNVPTQDIELMLQGY